MAEFVDQFSFSGGCVPQQANKIGEAYTEKFIGHRGCASLKCWYRSENVSPD